MASSDYLKKYLGGPPRSEKPKKKKVVSSRNVVIHDDDAGWDSGAKEKRERLQELKPTVVVDGSVNMFRGISTFKAVDGGDVIDHAQPGEFFFAHQHLNVQAKTFLLRDENCLKIPLRPAALVMTLPPMTTPRHVVNATTRLFRTAPRRDVHDMIHQTRTHLRRAAPATTRPTRLPANPRQARHGGVRATIPLRMALQAPRHLAGPSPPTVLAVPISPHLASMLVTCLHRAEEPVLVQALVLVVLVRPLRATCRRPARRLGSSPPPS